MSVEQFDTVLLEGRYPPGKVAGYRHWIGRYAQTVPRLNRRLPIVLETVRDFMDSLVGCDTPTSQRMQALAAIEMYRDLVLSRHWPSLAEFRAELQTETLQTAKLQAKTESFWEAANTVAMPLTGPASQIVMTHSEVA